ncbi:acyltransferase [Gordonia sp. ABSL1-1]|uniref:acyltransferase family protein n=1 Tax=Gordonia sp. ABSL1-1 TaxID=3053923 RepID=UPI0025725A9E|nr:acyltransferase [Gordonia sp. ABSL1-1]MDL9938035.1 acyltransferase [Gordonia sp. ABSL1-1]
MERRPVIVTEQVATAPDDDPAQSTVAANTDKSTNPGRVSTATSTDAVKQTPKPDKHLYQIDFVRLVTFASVILDHIILVVPALVTMSTGALGMLLRYTRDSFFALTGFVLTYQYRDRELKATTFWRRRYKLIGLPFVTWTFFYWFYNRYLGGGWADLRAIADSAATITEAIKSIGYDLVLGHAMYHLYFLSVSMQIYAVFPLILWVLRRTWGYHRYLLAAAAAFHFLLLHAITGPWRWHLIDSPLRVVVNHIEVTILPYILYILVGCVAAMHFPAFQSFMSRFRWPVIASSLVVVVATVVYFVHEVDLGIDIERASNVFLVHNAFAYIAIIAILYCLGTLWQDRRRPGSVADNFMRTAADRSFGIYLAHALALSALLPTIDAHLNIAPWPRMLLSFAMTVVLTVFIVEVLRRSPISLITTGRGTLDWRAQNGTRSLLVGVGALVVGVALRLLDQSLLGNVVIATALLLIVSAAVVLRKQAAAAA